MAWYVEGMNYKDQWNQNRVDWLYQLARCGEVGASAVRIALLFGTFLQPEERESVKPKYQWLTENGRMSRATLATALRELEEAGFLVVERFHAESNNYSMPFTGDEVWRRERTAPFEPKARKNPPRGRRPKSIEFKN